jgi:hypothetical protein
LEVLHKSQEPPTLVKTAGTIPFYHVNQPLFLLAESCQKEKLKTKKFK